jgi:HTH-type transcriptional regulator / antitoxin HipB
MRSFRQHLKEKLKDERFRRLYEEEKQLAELSLKILDIREHLGLSQTEVARKAKVTQQQLSKIENGVNCNIATFLKVCNALGIKLDIEPPKVSHLGRRTARA